MFNYFFVQNVGILNLIISIFEECLRIQRYYRIDAKLGFPTLVPSTLSQRKLLLQVFDQCDLYLYPLCAIKSGHQPFTQLLEKEHTIYMAQMQKVQRTRGKTSY